MDCIGVDGCRYGWVAASLEETYVRLFRTADELVAAYPADTLFLIDIPIGLDSAGSIRRTCDADTRRRLPPGRKSSVFPVPCREAVFSTSYAEASASNRAVLSKGLPIQSWMICPKIAEVDVLLRAEPGLRTRVRESHPELAFQALNGSPLAAPKKAAAGSDERLRILNRYEPAASDIFHGSAAHYPRKHVAKDDILDALCLAVTLRLLLQNGGFGQGYPTDETGLEMHIHVFDPAAREG